MSVNLQKHRLYWSLDTSAPTTSVPSNISGRIGRRRDRSLGTEVEGTEVVRTKVVRTEMVWTELVGAEVEATKVVRT